MSQVITVLFPSKDIQGMVFPCFDCIIVSVIYCSVAINPKFSGLNNIYYLTVPVEQEFRSDLAALAPAWSFLWCEVAIEMPSRSAIIWRLDGAGGWIPRWFPHMAVGGGLLLRHMDLSIGLLEHPHTMEAGFPQSRREQGRSHIVFYT